MHERHDRDPRRDRKAVEAPHDQYRDGQSKKLPEGLFENERDPIFLEYIAGAPEKAKAIGKLDVKSGALAITPSTDGCEDVKKKLAKLKKDTARRAIVRPLA